MRKGIVLFDLQDFLYQGTKGETVSIETINERQARALDVVHTKMRAERERRSRSLIPVPTVDIFLPTGDGYFMLCPPGLEEILDISHCIMAMLSSADIKSYCVAHIGEINVFTDMTGKENATGYDLGYASRLQSLSRDTEKLICSENVLEIWEDNEHFALSGMRQSDIAKDGLEYYWELAQPKDFEAACTRFGVME